MENTVEMEQQQELVPDDAALEPMQEQEEEPLSSLEEITGEQTPDSNESPAQDSTEPIPQKEPGWMKKKMEAYASKALQEQEARLRAEFSEMLAPFRESMYERQADALVASGEFKNKERALEYVKLKAGIKAEPDKQPQAQPRDEQGRFMSRQSEVDAEAKARAKLLVAQSNKIKASKGLDVAALYNSDPDVKSKILSGEWDFYDVAESMSQPKRRVPSPVRSSNSAMAGNNNARAVADMSDAQFERLLENLAKGKVYDMR